MKFHRKTWVYFAKCLILCGLLACSGSGGPAGGGGGGPLDNLQGGPPGTGSGSHAVGDVISAKSDWEGMTTCPPVAKRWRMHYNPGFTAILDSTASKTSPVSYQLTTSHQAPLLLEAFQLDATPPDGKEYNAPVENYQVRMVLSRDGKALKYQDVTLPKWPAPDGFPNNVFQNIPANVNDVLSLYVYYDMEIQKENTPAGIVKTCPILPPKDLTEAPAWKDINDDQLKPFTDSPFAHFVGALQVAGFSQDDAIYKPPEAPFSSLFRVLYGSSLDKILDPNPKTAATTLNATDTQPLKLQLQIDYHFDVSDMSKHEWTTVSEAGTQIRAIVIPVSAKGVSDYRITDLTLDGFVQLAGGLSVSYTLDKRPSADELKGASNVSLKDLNLKNGERLDLYYYNKIDTAKSTPPTWVYLKAPAITDDKSLQNFKDDSDTHPLGSFTIFDLSAVTGSGTTVAPAVDFHPPSLLP